MTPWGFRRHMEGRNLSYRAAVVGCGRIGADTDAASSRIESHAHAYKAQGRTDLTVLCDPDAQRLATAGKRWGVETLWDDPARLVDAEVDLVSVCTPPDVRGPILQALAHNPHVKGILIEKPLGRTPQEAQAVQEALAFFGGKVAVNYTRRYPPAYKEAAARIRSGALGEVQHVRVLYTKGIVHNGTHGLDLFRFFFDHPRGMSVHGRPWGTSSDPSLDVRLDYVSFEACLEPLATDAANIFELDLIGTEGRMIFRDQGHVLEVYGVEDTLARHGFRQLQPDPERHPTDLARGIHYAVADLIAAVEEDRAPGCTVQDARAAAELAFDAIASTRFPSTRSSWPVGLQGATRTDD